MSKFIKVSGAEYSDYAVDIFEESGMDIKEIYKQMVDTDAESIELEIDGVLIEFELVEFGDVDDEFVSWVKNNLCDYDQLKDVDIFRVE